MRILLLQFLLLRFFKKIHKFALCEFMPYALRFFSRTKSRIRQEPSVLISG